MIPIVFVTVLIKSISIFIVELIVITEIQRMLRKRSEAKQ